MNALRLTPIIIACGMLAACGSYQAPFNAAELHNDITDVGSKLGTQPTNENVAQVESVSQKTFDQLDSLIAEADAALAKLEAAKGDASTADMGSLNKVKSVLETSVAPTETKLVQAQSVIDDLKKIVDQVGSVFPNNTKLKNILGKIKQYEGLITDVWNQIQSGKNILKVIVEQVVANIDKFIPNPLIAMAVKLVAQLVLSKLKI